MTKVAFDTYTEHTNASLARVFWLSRVTEGKAGAVIVAKIRECLPALALEYKTTRGLHVPVDRCEITEFSKFFVDTLAVMVEPKQQEVFYKPPRLDHNGKPIQQKGQLAVENVDKTKSMAAKPIRKEGRLAKVQIAKSITDVGKVLPRIPVVISDKIKSQYIKRVYDPNSHSMSVKK